MTQLDSHWLEELHARGTKGLSPVGYQVTGLVMADPLARLLLPGDSCELVESGSAQ